MPFCKWAITQAIPNTQQKPGSSRDHNGPEMQPPCSRPNPPEHIKGDQDTVADKKEDIQKVIYNAQWLTVSFLFLRF